MITIIILAVIGYFLCSFIAIGWILYQITRAKKRGEP